MDSRGADSRTQAIVEAQTTHPVKTQSVEYSFARSGFANECERALNAQINVEYNVSYIYHAMWAYFSRDNVALKGFAEHFKREALEERAHAEQLMEYVNLRGGSRRAAATAAAAERVRSPGEGMRAVRARAEPELGKVKQR